MDEFKKSQMLYDLQEDLKQTNKILNMISHYQTDCTRDLENEAKILTLELAYKINALMKGV